MDKPRWLISYWFGLMVGLLSSDVHGVLHFMLIFGAPLAAGLTEVIRSEIQKDKWF